MCVELVHSVFSFVIRLFVIELAYFHKRLRLNLRSCTVMYRASNTVCIDMARRRRDILVTTARRHTCTATLKRHSHKARAAMRMPLKTHFTCSYKRVNKIYKTPAPSILKIHSAHETVRDASKLPYKRLKDSPVPGRALRCSLDGAHTTRAWHAAAVL